MKLLLIHCNIPLTIFQLTSLSRFFSTLDLNDGTVRLFGNFPPAFRKIEESDRGNMQFSFNAQNEELQPIDHTCKTIYFIKSGIARIYYYKDGIDITEYFAFKTVQLISKNSKVLLKSITMHKLCTF
ncbi:hypothetical protein HPE56_05785 [Maribacter sp. ANRC-HE7]|uniref:Cyclic nucleotide-binding domain-containing protein n=1 Tax=Maribacter aquimaris TaxID=2737171 RepID=A0ABR7UXJ6_9FLAO|nr:hypothetical protein [Maribacter aquimaris]MBD0777299.1 hypothetical protein [Maribacter aquimaris]